MRVVGLHICKGKRLPDVIQCTQSRLSYWFRLVYSSIGFVVLGIPGRRGSDAYAEAPWHEGSILCVTLMQAVQR